MNNIKYNNIEEIEEKNKNNIHFFRSIMFFYPRETKIRETYALLRRKNHIKLLCSGKTVRVWLAEARECVILNNKFLDNIGIVRKI